MAFVRNVTKDDVLNVAEQIGPKALLVTATGIAVGCLRKFSDTIKEAHHTINNSTILVTAAGWLSFCITTYRSYNQNQEYQIKTGQHYPYSWRAKVGGALFAAAGIVGGVGLQKSGTPGEEITSFSCAGASGALAMAAGFFIQSETKALTSGQIRPYPKPEARGQGLGAPLLSDNNAEVSAPPAYVTMKMSNGSGQV